jgi:phosphatidylglycerophosphate synthase
MTLLDRLVVTCHLAGCSPIYIVSDNAPRLERAGALHIETQIVTVRPELTEPHLTISGGVLVERRDLASVIERGARLISSTGMPLPVDMSDAGPNTLVAQGVALPVNDSVSAAEAESALWSSLTSTADGVVDRFFNRPIGRILSKLLVHTSVSPNQVSVISILIGIASGWFFATGRFLPGAIILQICAIIDCVDGDLARALFKQSVTGKWLDLVGDQIVHLAVFLRIGIGVARANPQTPALLLGISAAIGVIFCLLVLLRGMRAASDRRYLFNKLVDAAANRDFSLLLLILALLGKMELFLWMAGIGIHLFWLAMLVSQFQPAGTKNA